MNFNTYWTVNDIPPQKDKLAIVTQGTNLLSQQICLELVKAGAKVILAAASTIKGEAAISKIRKKVPGAMISFEMLNLSNLESVRDFADQFNAQKQPVDILINNAATGKPDKLDFTDDGFEMHTGINVLGYFTLTLSLLPSFLRSSLPRVTTIINLKEAYNFQQLTFSGLHYSHKVPTSLDGYSGSQLAALLFSVELSRKCMASNIQLLCTAAFTGPVWTDTNPTNRQSLKKKMKAWITKQSVSDGALPILRAATDNDATSGCLYGPDELFDDRGAPEKVELPPGALDAEAAQDSWGFNEIITGCYWPYTML